jgi:hypothetical protein
MDVEAWLNDLGLPQYAKTFAASRIDRAALFALTSQDLKALGVTALSHRRKILSAIEHLAAGKEKYRRYPGDDLPP